MDRGRPERVPELVTELIRLSVDVIYTPGSVAAAQAAKRATTTIPIVSTTPADSVQTGLVASLARPGGNITGLGGDTSASKLLSLLKEAVPTATRVAILWTPSNPVHGPALKAMEAAARDLGVQLQVVEVRGSTDFNSAFSAMIKERVGTLVVLPDPMFRNHQRRILDLAAKSRLPAMYWSRDFVDAGGLMAYGASIPDVYRQAATFVDKILRGAKPADLPIEQPAKLELVINLRTAKIVGLTIPQSLLLRADQVIE